MKKLPAPPAKPHPEFKLKRTVSIFDGGTLSDGRKVIYLEEGEGNSSDEDFSPENADINSPRLLTALPLIRSRSESALSVHSFFNSRSNPVVAELKADSGLSHLFQPKRNSVHRVKSDEDIHRHEKKRESVNPHPNFSVELNI